MISEGFTDRLAKQVMGWKVCPDRFIKSGRSWIPKWRFAPCTRLEDALELLDHASDHYALRMVDGTFTAEVRVGGRNGAATGESKAKTITLAVAQALGIEVPL